MKMRYRKFGTVGLMIAASLIGITAVSTMPKADASSLPGFYSPRAYNPPAKYYVQGGLFAYSRHAQINVRTGPGTHYDARHYGLPGDRVIILNEARDRHEYRWWYLKFNGSGAKGWIREDLVAIPDAGLREISRLSRL